MDVYVAPKAKTKPPGAECRLRNFKSEENAQKANFRQNNNAPANQMSFIPVYTKKTEMCHNFPKSATEDKNKLGQAEASEPIKMTNSLHSPPPRQKCLSDQIPGRPWNSHMRRRSVGFEDVTSLTNNYGYSISNSKRIQNEAINCNASAESALRPNNQLISENDKNFSYGKEKASESRTISVANQNSQVTENENNFLRGSETSRHMKDKSSKRKSSLNRMDFLDFPTACAGNVGQLKASHNQKNSSSDEESDTKSQPPKSEFLSSKRKHHVSSSQSPSKEANRQCNEIPLQSGTRRSKGGSHLLPRTLQNNHLKSRHQRRIHSAATHLQKFSHSAGELESLTDLSETAGPSHKICLSAQEFDPPESTTEPSRNSVASSIKKYPHVLPVNSPSHSIHISKNGGNASHCNVQTNVVENNSNLLESSSKVSLAAAKAFDSNKEGPNLEFINEAAGKDNPVLSSLELSGVLDLKHIDSRSDDDAEIAESTFSMKNLDISSEVNFDNEIYISADDICDPPESDSERRPSSILRKKFSEERKELHGILKPSSDDKQSKTLPSILKHRESSEEKDVWQQGDLHSILKKSTSEDESCNSGPDIRPILKVSTDDESPTCSMKPRPILKKRTSFSEECSYASYPNGELKPILKKKSPLASEDQPRPILKSRRKSEDTRSTLSEFIASRPRAYSADMGVKPNLETRFDTTESTREDLGKFEYQDL